MHNQKASGKNEEEKTTTSSGDVKIDTESTQQKEQKRKQAPGNTTSPSKAEGSVHVVAATTDGSSTVSSSWAPRHHYTDATTSGNASSMNSSSMPSSFPAATHNHRLKNDSQQTNNASKKNMKNAQQAKIHQPSLRERVGNSALSSTLGILKLFGDVTLSTTGTILSPSIEMTRQVLLPQLFAALADYISNISPQRLKDWFRILSASVHHIIAVIVSTERGSIFRHKFARAFGDVVDVASSDTSRQAIMDGMACFVKLGEALHTPEFKAFLDQLGTWGCRMVDTLGQDKNKKFIHDFWDLVWSAIELSNDPSTILALAEVAAYLCHALEMEDAAIHAIAKEREELNRKAAQNRKERNQYQQTTYQDSYVFGDPNATVEEVILSALGVIQKSVEEAKRNNPDDIFMEKDGVPGSVVLGSEEEGDDEETTKDSRTASSPKTQSTTNRTVQQEEDEQADRDTDNEEEDTDEEREVRRKVCEIDHHDIDTDVLRERIAKRSMEAGRKRLRRQNHGKTSTKSSDIHMRSKVKNANKTCGKKEDVDDGKKDIEELESLIQTSEGAETPKQTNVLNFEEDPAAERSATDFDDSVDPVRVPLENELPLEGETPVAHFYRVLDEVLTKRRVDAMDSVLSRSGLAKSEYGEDEHKGTGTLKDRLQKLRAAIGADKHLTPPLDPETIHYRDNVVKVERFLRKNKKLVLALVVMVLYFVVIFFAFGCYGIYMFVFPPSPKMAYTTIDTSSSSTAKSTTSGADLHLPLLIHEDFRKHQKNNEYVIRVIREVVHVNEKGETIEMEEHDEL